MLNLLMAATITPTTPTTGQCVLADFRAYLLRHVKEIAPTATPRELRRLRAIIARVVA